MYSLAKKTDYSKHVQKVENIKDFKKLLRTRINVLVLFGTSGKSRTFIVKFQSYLRRSSLKFGIFTVLHQIVSPEYGQLHCYCICRVCN